LAGGCEWELVTGVRGGDAPHREPNECLESGRGRVDAIFPDHH
jgi:hypothetical protein